MTTVPDRIEKKVLLRAPRSRVWRALTDSKEFGAWFGMKVEGPFVAGKPVHCMVACTTVDAEVAKMQKPHEGVAFTLDVEAIEPERLFTFRWHPFGVDKTADYSKEPKTLVAFELSEAPGGVLLTVTESGFDRIPLERRAKAFAANDGGWTKQCELITKYLALHAA
jgi:uncharacterized protein YndB with AHSA1/START domain